MYDMHAQKHHASALSEFPVNTPIAMAYVPFQQWSEPYNELTGLYYGTMFPELNLPFWRSEEARQNGQKG